MITAILAFLLSATPAHLSRTVDHSRFLARCSTVPLSVAQQFDGIEVLASYSRPGVLAWVLRRNTSYGVLVCYRLGMYLGMPVYACHGPTVLRTAMALASECSHAIPWSQVSALPEDVRSHVAARSTVCGWSLGRRSWPGSNAQATADATQIDGYGPGVVAGTDPCEEYQ
jgi:hypothetical protein